VLPETQPEHLPTLSPLSSPPSSPYLTILQIPDAPLMHTRSPSPTEDAAPRRKKRRVEPIASTGADAENIPLRESEVTQTSAVTRAERIQQKRDADVTSHAGPSKKRKSRASKDRSHATYTSFSISADRSDASCPRIAMLGPIVEAFALSRAASLSASALHAVITTSHPTLTPDDDISAVEAVLAWGAERGLFEALPSSGDALPPTWFYLPGADWDKERAGTHAALGGRSARKARRGYKQYYWKPVVLPRTGAGRRRAGREGEEDMEKGWDVDWEEA
jgi:hypothetical protein